MAQRFSTAATVDGSDLDDEPAEDVLGLERSSIAVAALGRSRPRQRLLQSLPRRHGTDAARLVAGVFELFGVEVDVVQHICIVLLTSSVERRQALEVLVLHQGKDNLWQRVQVVLCASLGSLLFQSVQTVLAGNGVRHKRTDGARLLLFRKVSGSNLFGSGAVVLLRAASQSKARLPVGHGQRRGGTIVHQCKEQLERRCIFLEGDLAAAAFLIVDELREDGRMDIEVDFVDTESSHRLTIGTISGSATEEDDLSRARREVSSRRDRVYVAASSGVTATRRGHLTLATQHLLRCRLDRFVGPLLLLLLRRSLLADHFVSDAAQRNARRALVALSRLLVTVVLALALALGLALILTLTLVW